MNIASFGSKTYMKRKVGALVLAAAALATVSVSQPARAQSGSGLGAPIEGTWIIQVHRVTQNITFSTLQSFTAGGVALATGTIDRTPPPPISPLYGTWKRIGGNRYAYSLSFFIFDEAGNAVAYSRLAFSPVLRAKSWVRAMPISATRAATTARISIRRSHSPANA